jgi:hypothetical protein
MIDVPMFRQNTQLKPQWIEDIGIHMIDEVRVTIGGDIIQRFSGDWLSIYYRRKMKWEKYNQIKHISTDLGSKIKELDEYKDNHFNRGNDEMWNAMLAVAEEHNLWDETIYSTYQEVKNILERLPFLEAITYHMSHGKEAEQLKALPLFKAMIDLCKYHKFKINSEHYMPIPVLTEETILETI